MSFQTTNTGAPVFVDNNNTSAAILSPVKSFLPIHLTPLAPVAVTPIAIASRVVTTPGASGSFSTPTLFAPVAPQQGIPSAVYTEMVTPNQSAVSNAVTESSYPSFEDESASVIGPTPVTNPSDPLVGTTTPAVLQSAIPGGSLFSNLPNWVWIAIAIVALLAWYS